jgi:phage shock protein C
MDTSPDTPSDTRPRLLRSRKDRVIGGVAGGIGHYLGVDPVLIRIAFVVLLFTGSGFLIYLVAWIVMPEAGENEDVAPQRSGSGSGDAVRLFIGGLLIAIGGFLLLDRVFPWDWLGRVTGPAILIAIGAGILVYGARR